MKYKISKTINPGIYWRIDMDRPELCNELADYLETGGTITVTQTTMYWKIKQALIIFNPRNIRNVSEIEAMVEAFIQEHE